MHVHSQLHISQRPCGKTLSAMCSRIDDLSVMNSLTPQSQLLVGVSSWGSKASSGGCYLLFVIHSANTSTCTASPMALFLPLEIDCCATHSMHLCSWWSEKYISTFTKYHTACEPKRVKFATPAKHIFIFSLDVLVFKIDASRSLFFLEQVNVLN